MLNAKSLQVRLALWIGLCLLAVGASLILYAAFTTRRAAIDSARASMLGTTRTQANGIQAQIETAMDAARTLAQVLATVKSDNIALSRDQVNAMLKHVLTDNPDFLGVYTVWEPNAFDGLDAEYADTPGHDQTGRFIPYWVRGKAGDIWVEPLMDYEKEGPGDYYQRPKRTGRECIIDPYVYPVEGEDTLMTSLVVPITAGSTFYGMAGVDLRLEFLQHLADNVDVYNKTGHLYLISNNGTVAGATGRPDSVGQSVQSVPIFHERLVPLLQAGQEDITTRHGELQAITPIRIGQTVTPWSVLLQVPEREIMAAANVQLRRMIGIASALILAGVLIAAWLLRVLIIKKVNRLVAVTREFAAGRYDARSQLEGQDELCVLGRAFDSMADQVGPAYAELSRREAALRDSGAVLTLVLNSVPQSIFWKDRDCVYVGCNEVFAKAVGLDRPEQVAGKTDFDLPWQREEAEAYRTDDREVMETKQPKRHIVEPLRQADGTRLWIDTTKVPLIDAQGHAYGVLGVYEDITERKRAEEALAQSEAKLRALIDAAPYGAHEYELQPDGELLFAGYNPAAGRILGIDHAALVGLPILRAFPDLIGTHIPDAYRQVGASGGRYEDEHVVYDHGQIHGAYEISAFQTRPNRMAVLFRDITERKRAEEALRASEEKHKALIETTDTGFVILDREGKVLDANAGYVRLTGHKTLQEILGRFVGEWTAPHDRIRNEEEVKRCLSQGSARNLEIEYIDEQGRLTPIEVNATVLGSGEGARIVSLCRDISDRNRMRHEARMEERRLQGLLRLSQKKVSTLHELLDLATEEVAGLSDSRFGYIFHYSEDTQEFTLHAWSRAAMEECSVLNPPHIYQLANTGIWGEAVRQRRPIIVNDFAADDPLKKGYPEGHVQIHRFMTVPVFNEGRIVAVAGVADKATDYSDADVRRLTLTMDTVWQMVERRRAEEALREMNAVLEQRVKERTAIAEARATQLRSLASQLTTAEHRERRRVANILHEHFQQLLVSAKFSLGALRRRTRDASLQPLLEQADDAIDESIKASRSLTVELCPPLLYDLGLAAGLDWLGRWMYERYHMQVDVQADPRANPQTEDISVLLFHSVREVLFNIVKHARVDRAVVKMDLKDADHVEILVADEGAGFEVARPRLAAEATGGFGLFSIRERIEMVGGRLDVDSSPGKGTRIRLLAPVRPPLSTGERKSSAQPSRLVAETRPGEEPPLESVSPTMGKIHVLIADDHAIVRDGLIRLLQMEPDIEVVGQAADGRMAVGQALQIHPDVVLMDVAMPEMDGIEATRHIKEQSPGIRVIGLSMHPEQDVAQRMREAGAVAYLAKTTEPEDLVAAIRTCSPLAGPIRE